MKGRNITRDHVGQFLKWWFIYGKVFESIAVQNKYREYVRYGARTFTENPELP